MSYLFNAFALVLAFSVVTTGCSKKGGGKRSARPAPAASSSAAAPTEKSRFSEADLEDTNRGGPEVSPERFSSPRVRDNEPEPRLSDEESRRFDNSRYTEVPAPPLSGPPDREVGDAPEAPEIVREPREEEVDTTEPGNLARNSQCGTAYRHSHPKWAPGLPNPPLDEDKRICTGGSEKVLQEGQTFQCAGNPDRVYTDARQDGLMALAVDQVNRLPRHMDRGSRELAQRIADVKIDAASGRAVRAQVKLLVAKDTYEEFNFRGSSRNSRGESGIQLRAENAPRGLKFSALLTCADTDGGCQNAILRLQQLSRSGRVGRVAYVILRSGEAHVTITELDRTGFSSIQNHGHKQFAEYLSNTTYNTCVSILRQALNGDRKLPSCAYQRLKAICGRRARFKQPAAQAFEFNSWSVAYGKAGFVFEMIDRGQIRFKVSGPLLAGPQTPVYDRPLKVTGSLGQSIEQAILVANDGGGNLNLQIDFDQKAQASTRFSITTLIEDVRYSSDAVMARARQMPALSPNEMVDERELQDDARERDERRGRTQPRTVTRRAPVAKPAAPVAPAKPVVPAEPAVPAKPATPEKPKIVVKPAPAAQTPPETDKPAVANPGNTRPVPKVDTAVDPGAGPRFNGPAEEVPPTGVPPHETEDNDTIQPQ